MTLRELLARKASGIITIKASTNLLQAIELMCDRKVGSLLVESGDGGLLGIATERDILRACYHRKGDLTNALVDDAMTRDIIVASPETSVDEAMSMMTEHRFRHLPILDDGKPIGIISIGDLVKAQLKDITVEIKYLREYIAA
ncbi:CBS domain-containing protein [Candidatus Vondammii sp. HM_W22]|uniref:CBS domain-containing protein n=1 Tax=Candidatus Vondammii sp. HM_W22 TaxID=2687299 RepID=UPI001F142367|nr:CBS domain-containing protein [Candidatus Vondammii sp. HM_W22]